MTNVYFSTITHLTSCILRRFITIVGVIAFIILSSGCTEAKTESNHAKHQDEASVPVSLEPKVVPEDKQPGETLFNANCARCHGKQGSGTKQGPPLVHKIYEPNHHADFAFQRAAAQGVRAHHWKFGNMPKIEGVTPKDVTEIISYVRWLQQQAGIF